MPIARVRNDASTAKVRNTDVPKIRVKEQSFIQNPGTIVKAGTPIGLLLVWTYTNSFITSQYSTFPGSVRIRNTD